MVRVTIALPLSSCPLPQAGGSSHNIQLISTYSMYKIQYNTISPMYLLTPPCSSYILEGWDTKLFMILAHSYYSHNINHSFVVAIKLSRGQIFVINYAYRYTNKHTDRNTFHRIRFPFSHIYWEEPETCDVA